MRRGGEARRPGLVVPMPCDGNCLIHLLGYYVGQTQKKVRRTLAMEASGWWQDHFGWGLDDGVWGEGRHLALASRVYRVRIRATGGLDYTFGRDGPEWKVRYSPTAEHYDVVEGRGRRGTGATVKPDPDEGKEGAEETKTGERTVPGAANDVTGDPRRMALVEPGGRRAHLGGAKKHIVMTINVGGSREALVGAMVSDADVLLVQEHGWIGRACRACSLSPWVRRGTALGTDPMRMVMGVVGVPQS